jgi:hypothetical protein
MHVNVNLQRRATTLHGIGDVVRGDGADMEGGKEWVMREWEHEPFLDLSLEATIHAGDVIFQPGMFCEEWHSLARILCTTRRLQDLIAQVPQRHITHLTSGGKQTYRVRSTVLYRRGRVLDPGYP